MQAVSAARAGRKLSMHQAALERSSLLQQHCGSLHLGSDLTEQLAFSRTITAGEQPARSTLRFRCSPQVMAVVRQELELEKLRQASSRTLHKVECKLIVTSPVTERSQCHAQGRCSD
jgi:histidine ammonia-lyase